MLDVMVMERICQTIKLGDVIGVDYGYYQHFGIYIGDYEVIHYFQDEEKKSDKVTIQITKYETFLGYEEECFVCDFTKFMHPPDKFYNVKTQSKSLYRLIDPKLNLTEEFEKESTIYTAFQTEKYKIYSPQETVRRAYQRLGEICYDPKHGTMEHFIIWCKTGIDESSQANAVLKVLKQNWVLISMKNN